LLEKYKYNKVRLTIALKIAYVSQHYESNRQTVFDAVLLGRKPHIKWEATPSDLTLVHGILCKTGLGDFASGVWGFS